MNKVSSDLPTNAVSAAVSKGSKSKLNNAGTARRRICSSKSASVSEAFCRIVLPLEGENVNSR